MRLTPQQQSAIRTAVIETFGEEATIWLFGSRVDDNALGGDLDLMLELPEPLDNPARLAAQIAAQVSRTMNGRKVDVLLSAPNLMKLPIHDMAIREGIEL